jgi:hypothetical protein
VVIELKIDAGSVAPNDYVRLLEGHWGTLRKVLLGEPVIAGARVDFEAFELIGHERLTMIESTLYGRTLERLLLWQVEVSGVHG